MSLGRSNHPRPKADVLRPEPIRLSGADMRLADFILRDMESILVEWEAFAATLFPAATNMTSLALRDDAKRILEAVATDLSTPQTKQAQADKSLGEPRNRWKPRRQRHKCTPYCVREAASTSTSWPPRTPRPARQRPSPVDRRVSAR